MTLSLSIATIAWFSKNFTLWSYDYDTFQPIIGQCDKDMGQEKKDCFYVLAI